MLFPLQQKLVKQNQAGLSGEVLAIQLGKTEEVDFEIVSTTKVSPR